MQKKEDGFTLLELLIVITILALLASIITPSVSGFRSKARDTRRILDLREIRKALEFYHNDQNNYPFSNFTQPYYYCDSSLGWFRSSTVGDHCDIGPLGPGSSAGPSPGDYWYSSSNLQPLVDAGYISKLPTDPSGAGAKTHYYMYKPCKDGRGYLLRGVLENPLRPYWVFTHQNLMMDKNNDHDGNITVQELNDFRTTCEGADLTAFPQCIDADWDGDGDVDSADTALGAPFAGKTTCS
ncbi:MAG: hypothetical protein A3C80_01800 [Candidatus Ryanbacteria bacterium RIFCSPHIGHO2_02_FULL_45_43]|uniref:Uncharacterized protein n=1 Tax=Candidatus Ryanbacteria bacterium RIFCSPHIGHO2_01_45_13 TaxID=1802112 RepID=A0A1G2FY15_9BACT|nr:MAG: hypothetical protein A2718_02635 [Candidatus Ryanbacteria bacterium RIFCSPHIGHO2_01_FULL_44_130]OGZ42974.1 MAG: hypothetical protein A2W41_02575 [Candidatus Ryanbacteria bacterium RIFCSPHIGHO2_01_45_13]OGZ48679.1 MAG: hypothetical protein A3C80_01800 [Candidatus Ryanbacteria bacterium RIFCSPHIGHO2_02_FULL_45_43]OGZ50619.1 MAG: hypothetical protein A3E55_03280 [Candidatus Ryanbacteria bacterium RIFCSPHIGHO2_12_FULL_44_20]OGZ51925.1 MAG: hypothetical protein A3A17_00655 [Candidatus Ryanba